VWIMLGTIFLPRQGDGIADTGAGLAGGAQGDEARIAMVVIHPVRDQDTRSEMAIIAVINELNIGAVIRTRDEAGGPASLSSWYRHTTPVRHGHGLGGAR